jgi:hypothetical protein
MRTIEIIGIAAGIILFLIDVFIHIRLRRKGWLIKEEDENKVLFGFISKYIGLWLFFIFTILWLHRIQILPFGFNALVGGIAGIFPGTINFSHWALSDDKYEKRPALGEPIGGMAMGCGGFLFSILIGVILGLIL